MAFAESCDNCGRPTSIGVYPTAGSSKRICPECESGWQAGVDDVEPSSTKSLDHRKTGVHSVVDYHQGGLQCFRCGDFWEDEAAYGKACDAGHACAGPYRPDESAVWVHDGRGGIHQYRGYPD